MCLLLNRDTDSFILPLKRPICLKLKFFRFVKSEDKTAARRLFVAYSAFKGYCSAAFFVNRLQYAGMAVFAVFGCFYAYFSRFYGFFPRFSGISIIVYTIETTPGSALWHKKSG